MSTNATTPVVLEHDIGSAGRLRVRQLGGSIRVQGTADPVVRVRRIDGGRLEDAFRIERSDDGLALLAPERFGIGLVIGLGRRSAPDLDIEVPRGASVSLEAASADIVLAGLAGRSALRTASGDAVLDDVSGVVEIEAVSGDTRIEARGPLELRARTISGDLAVRAVQVRRAEIGTTSGEIRLDAHFDGPGPFAIDSVSGDATIVGRGGLRIEGRSVTGTLMAETEHRLETGPGRRRLVVGDGATSLSFNSVSGDLRVVAPRDTLARSTAASVVAETSVAPEASVAAPPPPSALAAGPGGDAEAGQEVARLDVLRAVERGELSVELAMVRLAEIEEA
jgi:hypothetical protein